LTSSRASQARPVEKVVLKVSFRAGKDVAARIRREVPGLVVKGGYCELVIRGERPAEVADRAREVLEKLRGAIGGPSPGKDFKLLEPGSEKIESA
jgi:hypothetical protein